MYTLPPSYSYCQQSPCYSDGDDRIYKKKRTEITGKQRVAANERERKRMNSINRGFEHLRQRLPTMPQDKKLSKVDTLKGAIQYIRELQALLEQELPNNPTGEHKLLINNTPEGDAFYMVSWRRTPEKYGDIHATARGTVVYQKDVWIPGTK
ncbi:Helix-loop-helix DNA-binding domain protein [Oesophagostomum dentatum]|uniref:Helix-loop-helix DNA-binding domain protein n=1 Tax=Oesophagostomum dentatum TaxID=61180 RepID=A0A0B1SB20_OESDE|nr:Helix-loop-helix DNA-binding domain protein [Oesophagostomum dentatum]